MSLLMGRSIQMFKQCFFSALRTIVKSVKNAKSMRSVMGLLAMCALVMLRH